MRCFTSQRSAIRRLIGVALLIIAAVALGLSGRAHAATIAFQAAAHADCADPTACVVSYPRVPAAKRLNATFVACRITSPASGSVASVNQTRFYLQTKSGRRARMLAFATSAVGTEFDGANWVTSISQAVAFSVEAGERPSVVAEPQNASSVHDIVGQLDCTIVGAMTDAADPSPYAVSASAACSGEASCTLAYPSVPAGRRFDVEFVSCSTGSTTGATASASRLSLQTQQNGTSIALNLASAQGAATQIGDETWSALNQSVAFTVVAGQALQIVDWPKSGTSIDDMSCTAVGNLADASTPAPYMATASIDCSGETSCTVTFPAIVAGKRLDVTFASCQMRSDTGAAASTSRLYLQTAQSGEPIAFNLEASPGNGADGYSAVSQAVDVPVAAETAVSIVAWPTSKTFADQLDCTIVGNLNDATTPAPYLAAATAQCSDIENCAIALRRVSRGRRLDVGAVTCELQSKTGAVAASSRFYLQTKVKGKNIALPLANRGDTPSPQGKLLYSAVSRQVEFSVPEGEVLRIFAWPAIGTHIDEMNCTVAGAMNDAATPAPYIAEARASCGSANDCAVRFPAVPLGSTLEVHSAACDVASTVNDEGQPGDTADTSFYLQTRQKHRDLLLFLESPLVSAESLSDDYHSAIAQRVTLSVPAGQRPRLFAWPTRRKPFDRLDCTITGRLVTGQ